MGRTNIEFEPLSQLVEILIQWFKNRCSWPFEASVSVTTKAVVQQMRSKHWQN